MNGRLTKLILTVAAMVAITTAQAAETEILDCPSSPARVCPSSPDRIIYVRPNSVTIWEAPEPFKQVFVGNPAEGNKGDKEDKDLITASAAAGLGDRLLVLSVREPKENLFGFGEAIIGRGNVVLYNDKKEVAHLIVEVTPLNGPSHRITLINAIPKGPKHFRLECDARECYPAFKEKEPTAIETRPDGTVRKEYAPK
jgi:hypothetical protein